MDPVCQIQWIQLNIRISSFKTGSGPGLSRIQLDPAKPDPDPVPVQKTWSWIPSGSNTGWYTVNLLMYPDIYSVECGIYFPI